MHRLAAALLVLVVVIAASDVAELPGQVYWKKVLPNTPMPRVIKNLLKQAGDIYHEQSEAEKLKDSTTARWNYRKQSGTKMLKDSVTNRWNYRKPSGTEMLKDSTTARWNYRKPSRTEMLKDSVTNRWNYRKQSGNQMLKDSTTARWNYRKQNGTKMLKDSTTARWNYRTAHNGTKTRYDPDVAIFFIGKDLQPGSRMTLHFPDPSTSRAPFISRSEASLLPFTSSKLPEILDHFSIQPNSNDAESMRYTLTECEEPSLEGEKKHCATSLESMIDFSTTTLGSRDVLALSTSVDRENSPKQQYEIISIRAQKEMSGYSSVLCHAASYVYAVFSCHATEEAKTYQVSLVGKDGTRVAAMATCHTDTSKWDPEFFAFQMLGVKPGTVPICHFLHQDLVLWTPSFK